MKVLKAMIFLCVTGIAFAIAGVDHNDALVVVILFFCIAGTFFCIAHEQERKLIKLNNDLYERSN